MIEPLPPLKRRRSQAEFGMALLAGALALGAVGLGTSLIAGGELRMSTPSFAYLREIASSTPWGVAFLVTGLLALAGQIRPSWWKAAALGHFLTGGLLAFWTYALIRASTDPRAALTGIAMYASAAAAHWIITVVSRPESRP